MKFAKIFLAHQQAYKFAPPTLLWENGKHDDKSEVEISDLLNWCESEAICCSRSRRASWDEPRIVSGEKEWHVLSTLLRTMRWPIPNFKIVHSPPNEFMSYVRLIIQLVFNILLLLCTGPISSMGLLIWVALPLRTRNKSGTRSNILVSKQSFTPSWAKCKGGFSAKFPWLVFKWQL